MRNCPDTGDPILVSGKPNLTTGYLVRIATRTRYLMDLYRTPWEARWPHG